MQTKITFLKKWLAVFFLFGIGVHTNAQKSIVGYYTGYNYNPNVSSRFQKYLMPSKMDFTKYNFVNYAFLTLVSPVNGHIDTTESGGAAHAILSPSTGNMASYVHAAGAKLILSIGGGDQDTSVFGTIARTPALFKVFKTDCIKYLNEYNADGIDIDWEFPSNTTTYANFIKQIRDTLTIYSKNHSKPRYYLTIAGPGTSDLGNYNFPSFIDSLDFVNVMAYDYTYPDYFPHWVGPCSPLYNPDSTCVDSTFKLYSYATTHTPTPGYGVPLNKINLGLAFYGRTWETSGTCTTSTSIYGCTATNWDTHIFTNVNDDPSAPGYWDYNQLLASKFGTIHRDTMKTPWTYSTTTPYVLLTYEDRISIGTKASYILSKGVNGAMVWDICDDSMTLAPGIRLIDTLYNNFNANNHSLFFQSGVTDRVTISNNSAYALTSNFTVEIKVKFTPSATGEICLLSNRPPGLSNHKGFLLYIYSVTGGQQLFSIN